MRWVIYLLLSIIAQLRVKTNQIVDYTFCGFWCRPSILGNFTLRCIFSTGLQICHSDQVIFNLGRTFYPIQFCLGRFLLFLPQPSVFTGTSLRLSNHLPCIFSLSFTFKEVGLMHSKGVCQQDRLTSARQTG